MAWTYVHEGSVPRDLRRLLVPGHVFQIEAVVLQSSGVVIIGVVVVVLLPRFRSRCRGTWQPRRRRERSGGSTDVSTFPRGCRRLRWSLGVRVEDIWIVGGDCRDPPVRGNRSFSTQRFNVIQVI